MTPPIKSAPLTPETPSCPFCGSTQVITIGKAGDVDRYWRCRTCGDIWNVRRLQFVSAPRWRR
jgi:transposase-like protein